jgi:hypothetical protein
VIFGTGWAAPVIWLSAGKIYAKEIAMPSLTQTEDKIEIVETMSTGIRIFLFVIGLLPWLAPYEFFVKHQWSEFSFVMIFFILIALGAIAVSLGFIGAAVFGMNQTTTFDLKYQTITHRYETAFNALQIKRDTFRDLTKTEVREHNWDSGPSTYSLGIYFKDGHKLLCGNFSSRAEAEDMLRLL